MTKCDQILLSIPKAAEALDVSVATVRRLIESGELPKVKIGGAVRIPARALWDLAAREGAATRGAGDGPVGDDAPDAPWGGGCTGKLETA